MSANDEDGGGGTALALAAIGGGAVLLWLLLRRGGKGWGWGGRGSATGGEGGRSGDEDGRTARRPVACIWVLNGDHIELNGVRTDLATMVAIARNSDTVHLQSTGDARRGFVEEVRGALWRAGVAVYDHAPGSGSCPPPIT